MKTLRTYGNLAEAGFAKSLLEAAGISAELADEQMYALRYGRTLGELRLQVQDGDIERASRVLDEGPDAAVAAATAGTDPAVSREIAEQRPRFPAGVFIAIAVGLGALLFAVHLWEERSRNAPAEEYKTKLDTNGDGRIDSTYFYEGERLLKAIIDRNRDGKPDEWDEYRLGILANISADNNFDGTPDVWYVYSNGDLDVTMVDTDFNQVPDIYTYHSGGVAKSSLVKPNGATVPTRRQTYSNGLLKEAAIDSNQDGVIDYRIEYDAFGGENFLPPR